MREVISWIGWAIDLAGVAVIAGGILLSLGLYISGRWGRDTHQAYRNARQTVGRGILLGLELLVAGDIIRTVALDPTFRSVGILAAIVAIRTFLSTTLEMEITGRWPWQQAPDFEPLDCRPAESEQRRPRKPRDS